MNRIQVREARSEVLIFIDKHCPDRLTAIREAAKILNQEIVREEANPRRNADWKSEDTL